MKQWVLVLTNSSDATADFLTGKLEESGVRYTRLDTDVFAEQAQLTATESESRLGLAGARFTSDSFSHVWLRRPHGLHLKTPADSAEALHMEQEWSAALEGWLGRIRPERWINHPAYNGLASYKVEQLWRAKQMGLPVPATLVTQSRDEAQKFYAANKGAIVVKPIQGGYIEREARNADTVIYTHAISPNELSLFSESNACPTLLQERIWKKCDVRITMVDDDLHAVSMTATDNRGEQRLDIRSNRMAAVRYEPIKLTAELDATIRRYVGSYQLRFAAVDMALDKAGNWIFFELNPNGEWAWLDQSGASDIAASFIKSFQR